MDTEASSEASLHLVLEDDSRDTTQANRAISPVAKAKPMEIKVKSSDGKPKNIQITTLSSLPSKPSSESNLGSSIVPTIKVKSVDGKPMKHVQITTLATFTSPKSKGKSPEDQKNIVTPEKKDAVLREQTENRDISDCIVIEDTDDVKGSVTTPKTGAVPGSKIGEEKCTPKRVQLTTIQLFNTNTQSPNTKTDTS